MFGCGRDYGVGNLGAVVRVVLDHVAVHVPGAHVFLVRISFQRAVVVNIRHTVVVIVIVASVPFGVAVGILLVRVGDERAVVVFVHDQIVVVVVIAEVADTVLVVVALVWVSQPQAVVVFVQDTILVVIRVAFIPAEPVEGVLGVPGGLGSRLFVAIKVFLQLVGRIGAVVLAIDDAVFVAVIFARVADAVAVRILLSRIRLERTVVITADALSGLARIVLLVAGTIYVLGYSVVIIVVVAEVAETVLVIVALFGIGQPQAVVPFVQHAVAVTVIVALVPDSIAIHVGLLRIGYQRAVVRAIRQSVVVIVQVHAILCAVVIGIEMALVHFSVTVVVYEIAGFHCTGMRGC